MRVRAFALICLLVVLTACTTLPVGHTYLGSPKFDSTVVAPAGWEAFDAQDVRGNAAGTGPLFLQGFGEPGVDPTMPMSGNRPGGVLTVSLHPGLDAARAAAINAFVTDLDAAIISKTVTVIDEVGPQRRGDYEYRQWILELSMAPGTITRVAQTVMTGTSPVGQDGNGTELYVVKAFIVGCAPECFAANRGAFVEMENSWEVR